MHTLAKDVEMSQRAVQVVVLWTLHIHLQVANHLSTIGVNLQQVLPMISHWLNA